MSMDRILEPSAEVTAWGEVRPTRLALHVASSVVWGMADAGFAACVGVSRGRRALFRGVAHSPQAVRQFLDALPDRARDGAIASAITLFKHRWPVTTVASLLAAAAVLSPFAPDSMRPHAVATAMAAPASARAIEIVSRKPLAPGPAALQARLTELAQAYGEPVGVAVADIQEGWVSSVMGDAPFPQQSVSKLWVAITILDAIDHGRLTLDQSVMLWPEDRSVFNQPISYQITDAGYSTTIRSLMHHALINSDNAANDKLMSLAGGAPAVLDMIRRKSLEGVKLAEDEKHLQAHIAGLTWNPQLSPYGAFDAARSRLPHDVREAAMDAYIAAPYDGASPVGIVSGLAALKRGELLSRESTDVILDIMAKCKTGPRRLKGGLPADWTIAHKTGTGQDFKGASIGINDVGLITAPDGKTYAVAVMLQRTHKATPARLEFMQAVTKAVVETWRADKGRIPDLRPSDAIVAE
ncbi:MAG: serine hydrolase [Caulobacter sp.]|nr:serine hydrolase [Caulobacter sp.]